MVVIVDHFWDRIKDILFCEVVPLGAVTCLLDEIMLDNWVVLIA